MKTEVKSLYCKRCGHYWYPRQPEITICPKCKSPYWDKERKAKSYVRVQMPEHPRANKQGQVKRAVLVMEEHIGRFLESDEEVHHINNIPTDDRIENLQLTTHNDHMRIHKNVKNKYEMAKLRAKA